MWNQRETTALSGTLWMGLLGIVSLKGPLSRWVWAPAVPASERCKSWKTKPGSRPDCPACRYRFPEEKQRKKKKKKSVRTILSDVKQVNSTFFFDDLLQKRTLFWQNSTLPWSWLFFRILVPGPPTLHDYLLRRTNYTKMAACACQMQEGRTGVTNISLIPMVPFCPQHRQVEAEAVGDVILVNPIFLHASPSPEIIAYSSNVCAF